MRIIIGTTKILTYKTRKNPAWFGDQIVEITLLVNFKDLEFFATLPLENKPARKRNKRFFNAAEFDELYFRLYPAIDWQFASQHNISSPELAYKKSIKYLHEKYIAQLNTKKNLKTNSNNNILLFSRQGHALQTDSTNVTLPPPRKSRL